jgi:hypothetical protein
MNYHTRIPGWICTSIPEPGAAVFMGTLPSSQLENDILKHNCFSDQVYIAWATII